MAELGFDYARMITLNLASDYAFNLGLRSNDKPLSLHWLYNCICRWPDISVRKPRSLEIARAKSATRPVIKRYFQALGEIINKHGFDKYPHAIYNIDEKGLISNFKPPNILAGKTFGCNTGKRLHIHVDWCSQCRWKGSSAILYFSW